VTRHLFVNLRDHHAIAHPVEIESATDTPAENLSYRHEGWTLPPMIKNSRRLALLAFGAISLGLVDVSVARADTNLEIIPTAWRMQDYLSGGAVIYYTGSSCAQEELILPTTTPVDSVNRFWSTVLLAKTTNKIMGAFYNPTT
jgi:hypothetical protein